MKAISISFLGIALLAGCATTGGVPTGMKAGQFVDYACADGKRLAARAAEDGSTVRVRFEGGYELERKAAGVYEGEGWKFTNMAGTVELAHNGKVVAKGCKVA